MKGRKDRLSVRIGQFFEGAAEGPLGILALLITILLITKGLGWW